MMVELLPKRCENGLVHATVFGLFFMLLCKPILNNMDHVPCEVHDDLTFNIHVSNESCKLSK